jgi:hypothetical protein
MNLADAGVATDQVQRAGDPAIERLKVEHLVAALEPEPVHVYPVTGDLVRQPVIDRVHRDVTDL